MNNLEQIEIALTSLVVLIQLWSFTKTQRNIYLFRSLFPSEEYIRLSTIFVPANDLQHLEPGEILTEIDRYRNEKNPNPQKPVYETSTVEEKSGSLIEIIPPSNGHPDENSEPNGVLHSDINYTAIRIIETPETTNQILNKILYSVNTYLIRNRSGASDFNLIKDIVERNTDAAEENINLTISVPLYLGLMGTMLGILIGLFNISDLTTTLNQQATNDQLGYGINVLLGGVKIAMVASFMGLLLTTVNSGISLKGARRRVENRKNDFYTFLQIDLLPVINQSLASTLESLQKNLVRFNDSFTTNLNKLSGLFQTNLSYLQLQDQVLKSIEKADPAKTAVYNIQVLQELQKSAVQLEKFTKFVSHLNSLTENSAKLITTTDSLLERSGNFQTIAETIKNNLSRNEELFNFLSIHTKSIEGLGNSTRDSIIDVNNVLSTALKDLKESTQKSLKDFEEFRITEADALKNAMNESRTNLGNLSYLEELKNDVALMKRQSGSQAAAIREELVLINKSITNLSAVLKEKLAKRPFFRSLTDWFRKYYHKQE